MELWYGFAKTEMMVILYLPNCQPVGQSLWVDLHYSGNKAPFFIPLTASWILQNESERLQLLESLLTYIASKEGVIFASVKEIVNYFKHPVPLPQLKEEDFACVSSTIT